MSIIPAFVQRHIVHRPYLSRLLNNFGWLFVDRILRLGVGLIVSVWVARYLGPDRFGQLSYAVAIVMLLNGIPDLGIRNIMVRDLSQHPDQAGTTLASGFILQLLAGLASFLIALTAAEWLLPQDAMRMSLVIIVALTLVFKFGDVVTCWFETQLKSRYVVWVGSSVFLLISLTRVVLILLEAPLVAFAWVMVAESFFLTTGLILMYSVKVGPFPLRRAHFDRAKVLLSQSWPIILTGTAVMVQSRIDQVMLGNMLGSEEVGQYSAAMRMIEAFNFLPAIIASTLAPSIAQAKKNGEEQFQERLTELYRIMFVVFLAIAIPLFFFGNNVTILLFGSAYERAGELMSLFAIRLFFAAYGLVRSMFITNEGLFRYALITSAIGAVSNIALNYVLIPPFRSEGALIATIVSFLIMIILIDTFVKAARQNTVWMFEGTTTFYRLLTQKH